MVLNLYHQSSWTKLGHTELAAFYSHGCQFSSHLLQSLFWFRSWSGQAWNGGLITQKVCILFYFIIAKVLIYLVTRSIALRKSQCLKEIGHKGYVVSFSLSELACYIDKTDPMRVLGSESIFYKILSLHWMHYEWVIAYEESLLDFS